MLPFNLMERLYHQGKPVTIPVAGKMQGLGQQHGAMGKEYGAPQRILQFPDITGPGIIEELIHGFLRDDVNPFTGLKIHFFQ